MSARQLLSVRNVTYREASQEDEELEVAEEQVDEGEEADGSSASEGEVDEANSSSEDREGVRCSERDGYRLTASVVGAGTVGLGNLQPFT
jgi:hypothetical protein